jgi:hypothetical protein
MEAIGSRPELYQMVIDHLRERGIVISETVE